MNESQYDYRDINRALKRKIKLIEKNDAEVVLIDSQFLKNVSVALDDLVFYWSIKQAKQKQEANNAQK